MKTIAKLNQTTIKQSPITMKRNCNHMKKTLLLTLALGLAGATSLVAGNVDVYITGSTAFRANVYTACQKLFTTGTGTPVYYGDTAHGGASTGQTAKTAVWAMTGTPITQLANLQGSTLTIHGNFTGSIQGLQTTEQGTRLVWANADGTPGAGNNCATYSTNAPTIGMSDSSGTASPFPATGNFLEENVCVQPFVMCKSAATAGAIANINNVTWEQLEYGIPAGRIPLSAWTSKVADTNTFVYLMERTKDSGTRRVFTQGAYYTYNQPVGIYIYDYTNNFFYTPTTLAATTKAASPNGVVGPAGFGNANLNWGYGYVGGGDIATSLGNPSVANQAIACLSIGDAKGVISSTNWATVISYNGIWPTAAGPGIINNTGTNDYSPITLGYYPIWGFEVLVHPENTSVPSSTVISGQNMTYGQLGDNQTPGSFMGVFNAQSFDNGGVVTTGSIENEIILSQPGGASAIPLAAMANQRPNVGGTIYPPFN
jgi:hypothetical protein